MRIALYSLLLLTIGSCTKDVREVERVPLQLKWELINGNNQSRYQAQVPGDVYSELIDGDIIPHPFTGCNEKEIAWVSKTPWEYQAVWHVTDSLLAFTDISLQFKGLDTYATIKLNDSLIATTNNMFRNWEVPVRSMLIPGENTLSIAFVPPIEKGAEARQALGIGLPAEEDGGEEKVSPYARKAGYHFGWDFTPRLVTAGIWKPIELRCSMGTFIEDVAYDQSFQENTVTVDTRIRIQSDRNDELAVRVWHDKKIVTHQLVKIRSGGQVVPLTFQLSDVQRWWPAGAGDQKLYEFYVEILDAGQLVDSHSEHIGFRTLALDRSADTIGERFQFVVNDQPLFMKGANLVPPTAKEGESTNDAWLRMVKEMQAAHMNMVRIWGGGVYPPDVFFDACDRAGILVWQDFMFANTMVPDDPAFLQNVEEEVKEQVIRLRDHPCLALWCGNNEIEAGWKNWDWQKKYELGVSDSSRLWHAYQNLFQREIPAWVRSEDQHTTYIHTSPMSHRGDKEGLQKGDIHYWGVSHNDAIEAFDVQVGRFISAYGMQAYPAFETLELWADSFDLYRDEHFWSSRQKNDEGDRPILDRISEKLWSPRGPEEFVRLGQVCQAMAYERAIKAHRLSNGHCAGTLYWQLNDVWPGASWGGIEYDGKWKASQYAIEESYRAEVMRFVVENDSLWIELHADNETYLGEVDVRLFHNQGRLLWNERIQVRTNRLGGWPQWLFLNKAAKTKMILFAEWNDGEGHTFAEEEFLWVNPGDFWQAKPRFNVVRQPVSKGSYQFHIRTDKPVWRTWLGCSGFEPDVQCFAFPPDRVKTVAQRSSQRGEQLKFVIPEAVMRDYKRPRDRSLFTGLKGENLCK